MALRHPSMGNHCQPHFYSLKIGPIRISHTDYSKAEKITNEQLLKLDEVNSRVGINNISPQYTLDVGGTVNATTFIGDGSLITNIQVSDDRLVWQSLLQTQRIFTILQAMWELIQNHLPHAWQAGTPLSLGTLLLKEHFKLLT